MFNKLIFYRFFFRKNQDSTSDWKLPLLFTAIVAFSSMLMAGIDGIMNKLDPGAPMDMDLYELSEEEVADVPTVCSSLREALAALDRDRDFLKAGNVFSDDLIDGYIDLKMEEVHALEHTTHPIEFQMYYSS